VTGDGIVEHERRQTEETPMVDEMTPQARRTFLTSGTRTAILATTRADGRPHAVPVCFVVEGDDDALGTIVRVTPTKIVALDRVGEV